MLKNAYENVNMQCIFSPTKAMNFLSPKLLPSSSKSSLKLIMITIVLFLYRNVAAVELPNNEKIPAVIVFGDSIVDPGNNNNIGTIVKCNFPPYGRDFVGKRPTGRFSNGRVPSDWIAESVGVKKILPAYLDSNLKIQDLLTGVSFASGGSGYDPLTPKIVELYGLGARRIGVVSLPAIGCVPSQRTLSGGIDRGCSETANQAASLFNSKLSAQIDAFNRRLPEARLVYLDIYNTLLSLIQNPTQYGFEVINRGCCGTGNVEVSILCTRYSPGTCNDSSKYIFWDSYHPSEKGYEVITSLVFDSQVHKFF
ncbi:GDSL esterase/lipase EXL3-like [Malus domestica]|uniref:GDSL esterase/lipase EXL3-like n=1 Tax=Malus domestica TaxID=3750 RepID=UPI003974CAD1